MKKKILFSILFVLIMPFALLFAGCNENVKYKINFIVDEQVYYTIETSGDEYISLPNNPEKDGYEFVGWYLDKDTWQEEVKSSSFSNEKMEKNINVFAYFRFVENPILAQSISLNKTQLNLEPNEQQTLTATILPNNVTSRSIVWASSNTNIATVSNGLVKAINYGTAIITAQTNNNLTATCQVNIVDKSQNVQVEVCIDGQVVETLTTNATNDYKITAPQKPEDITTNPNAERYFYGWFVDSNYQTPLTEDRTFLSNGKIYGKWIDIYASNFVYSVSKGKATITLFTNTQNATVVVVPCYVNSFPVERIGAGAFINQTMLCNVIICDGIQYIDASAFYGCNSMQSIQLPNTLKEIGTSAFEDCELLTKIDFPNTLTKIGSNAFKNCGSLSCVNFKNSNWWLTNNEDYVFDSFIDTSNGNVIAENLTTSKNNKIWTNYTLYNINYNLNNGILLDNAPRYFCEYTQTFLLLNSQKKGYDFAGYYGNNNFVGNRITQVIKGTKNDITVYVKYSLITYSITYLLNDGTNNPNNPLTYNVEMSNIQLLDAQKDYYDFSNWTLGNKVISEIDTSLCEDLEVTANYTPTIYTITYVLNGGTNSNDNPTTYTIESPTITLTPATFSNETVSRWYSEENFINRVSRISKGSHGDIKLYARAGYDGYDIVIISNNAVTGVNKSFINEFSITKIIVPDSIQSINAGAFTGCGFITDITLPFIGDSRKLSTDTYQYPLGYIFGTKSYTGGVATTQYYYYGSSTSSIISTTYYIPSSLKSVTITGGNINYGAFRGCTSLTNVIIGNSVTSIGIQAFFNCSSLTSITIGNGVTSIGVYAFAGCSSLTNLTIPNSVTSIGGYAFEDCSSLKNITLPNSVTSIDNSTFFGCSSLTNITIPNSVTSIDGYAFADCSSLTNITIPNSVTSIGGTAFYNCSSLTSIIIDANNLVYDSRDNCNAIIQTSNNVLIVGCKSTIIPTSVTIIGDYAFAGCSSLTNITIPNSVTSIGGTAFYNCSSLKNITIPDSVTIIGNYAFAGCSSLINVYFENTSGWKVGLISGPTSNISSSDLSNTSTAATYLKNKYFGYIWTRED